MAQTVTAITCPQTDHPNCVVKIVCEPGNPDTNKIPTSHWLAPWLEARNAVLVEIQHHEAGPNYDTLLQAPQLEAKRVHAAAKQIRDQVTESLDSLAERYADCQQRLDKMEAFITRTRRSRRAWAKREA